ncbi:class I SAM-dependent methyltransferase [Winogradskyella vincentii]|uniref:Class I SAM-dependent methyltransferase n=1 Tax=Winogradskyella vincentii TaxID=2877122 RepID=A0ABS7XVI6_9FLAO|nr:class I SAM-dependent methyltransferase [Winogradskyella vincentii]MCA0151654.1 class I SAM-dependent methyltransferase [Winogradskyella vincentii]
MTKNYTVGHLIYDASIYDGMNTDLSDLQFYKRWLPKTKDALILELCCGTGRLTLPIAKEGYNITGVDFTASMLDQAKVKASNEGLVIKFIEADMRYLDLQDKFDLIFIPFNSIHHLYKNEDVLNAFNAVKKHLKPKGLFILDCFNPNIQFIVDGGKELKQISSYITEDGRKVDIKEIMHYENKTQVNRIEWHYYINGEFDSVQNLDMRMFYPQELNSYLEMSGFNILNKFGNFKEDEFNDTSDKQIFVCQLA